MKRDAAPSFERLVAIVNPGSTHYQRGLRYIEQLRAGFSENQFELIAITQQEYNDAQRILTKLKARLDSRTLLAIAAGDGTISLIINLLLTSSELPPEARRAVILPLWGGNANDLAYMVNGPVLTAKMPRLLQRGRVAAIRPLAVTVKHENNSYTKLAVCYTSFGASANAARNVGRPAHRHRPIYRLTGARFATDMASITRSILASKLFLSEIDGRQRHLYDLILINGSRLAKVNRVGPGNLAEPTFYTIRIHRKHPMVALYLAHFARGAAFQHATQTQLRFTVRQDIWAQWDGEAQLIKADSEINIEPSKRPFYVLTTKL